MINEHQITNTLEQVGSNLTMTDAEHARIARVLHEHMIHHPWTTTTTGPLSSPYTSTLSLWLGRVAVIGALALVVTGSTLIAAAHQSLPGDTLYGIKIGVTEEIQSFLKPTPAARLTFESQRTEERLNEAQILIARGEFDTTAQEVIKKSIEKHTQEITRQAKELAANDPDSYQEVTLLAQNSLSKKAEETKVLAEASLINLDPATHDTVMLATLAVTQQAKQTLDATFIDTPLDTSTAFAQNTSLDTSTSLLREVHPESSLESPDHTNIHYLSYIVDDIDTRIRIINEQAAAVALLEKETLATATPVTDTYTSDLIEKQTRKLDTLSLITTSSTKTLESTQLLDVGLLQKKQSELTILFTQITDIRESILLSNERLAYTTQLFLEKAEEMYTLLGTTIPDPQSILPTTNGVIIPRDI